MDSFYKWPFIMVMTAESDQKQVFSFAFTNLLQITLRSIPLNGRYLHDLNGPGMKNACCLLAGRKADFCHVAISCILSWEFTDSYLQGTETTL